jgi:hypothetical protein
MCGIEEESCYISMTVVVFPFQFISRTPHTCSSSVINLVATKKVRVLYMKTEVRFLLYLGSQWLVGLNRFISCTLNTHIMHGLRLAETGQWLWAVSTKTAVRYSLYLVSHSWRFLSSSLLVYRTHAARIVYDCCDREITKSSLHEVRVLLLSRFVFVRFS